MHLAHKAGIVANAVLSLFLLGYVVSLRRSLAYERGLVARLPQIIQMAQDEVWAEVAEERAKAARERVDAARVKADFKCPAPPKCPDKKCPDKKCPKCPSCPKTCSSSSNSCPTGKEWLLTAFEWPEDYDATANAHMQALECLRIVVGDRAGQPPHKALRLPKPDPAGTRSAKRAIARRVHPDKVEADWARPLCAEATRVINAIK